MDKQFDWHAANQTLREHPIGDQDPVRRILERKVCAAYIAEYDGPEVLDFGQESPAFDEDYLSMFYLDCARAGQGADLIANRKDGYPMPKVGSTP